MFMYLLAHSAKFKNLKKNLRANPELWGCAIFGTKMAHLSWTNIFWYKQLLLSSTYWPFSLFKILKNSYCGSIVVRMRHLWVQNGSFAPNNFFLWKIINIILIYLLAPFFVQNLKKNSSFGSRVMRMRNFWAQNSPFPRMRIFFRKPANEPCFFHSRLSTFQK